MANHRRTRIDTNSRPEVAQAHYQFERPHLPRPPVESVHQAAPTETIINIPIN